MKLANAAMHLRSVRISSASPPHVWPRRKSRDEATCLRTHMRPVPHVRHGLRPSCRDKSHGLVRLVKYRHTTILRYPLHLDYGCVVGANLVFCVRTSGLRPAGWRVTRISGLVATSPSYRPLCLVFGSARALAYLCGLCDLISYVTKRENVKIISSAYVHSAAAGGVTLTAG